MIGLTIPYQSMLKEKNPIQHKKHSDKKFTANNDLKKKEETESKTSNLAEDLFQGAIAFGLTEASKSFPGFLMKMYMFYRPVYIKYLDYKLKQHTSYREKISQSRIGRWCSRMYTGVTTNLHLFLMRQKISRVFLQTVQNKFVGNENNEKLPFPLPFKQVLLNVFFEAFDSMGENLRSDSQIETRFKGRSTSWEQKMIYRLHLLHAKGKLPRGFPDLTNVALDKYNFYTEIDKSLNAYLKEFTHKILKFLDPNFNPKRATNNSEIKKAFTSLFSYLAYRIEVRDQLQAVSTWYIKDVWIKPFLDTTNFFLLVLSSCGVKTTVLDQDGYGLGSSSNLKKTGRKFIYLLSKKASQSEFDSVMKNSGLKRAEKNHLALQQEDLCRKKLEDHFTHLFYYLFKGKEKPTTHNLYQKFKKAMEEIPLVGQAFNSIHLLGFGLFYCTTYLFNAKDGDSLFGWLFKKLSGRKLARSLAKALIHLMDHPMWLIVVMQGVNALEESLFNQNPVQHNPKESKEFEYNAKSVCKFLIINLLNQTDETLSIKERDNLLKKAMKHVVTPFLGSVKQYMNKLPTKEQTLNFVKETLSHTFEEYLLYIELSLYCRRSFVKIEDDYKFWQMWVQEHLIEWSDKILIIKGYKPSSNYYLPLPPGLKPFDSKAKKLWSNARVKRVAQIREFIKNNQMEKILEEPKYEKSKKIEKKVFELIEDYVNNQSDTDEEDILDDFVVIKSHSPQKLKWSPTFPRNRKALNKEKLEIT